MFKKFIFLFLLSVYSFNVLSQEKVLLRLNYKKGDQYETHVKMNQDMGSTVMKMEIKMKMKVEKPLENKTSYDTKSEFTYLETVIVNDGKKEIDYNSNMKEEELSEEGKKFRNNMAPFLNTKMFINIDGRGRPTLLKLEPEVKGVDQLTNQFQMVIYPEEPVSVGSSWTDTKNTNGVDVKLTYTIKEITTDKVFAELFGKIPLLPGSRIKGMLEIDRKTGVTLSSSFNMKADNPIMKLNNTTTVTVKKL
ncbi:DUF6263 family protein [Tenacibaculum jejuense]|uniref:Uncharacterized protein n=1 Tax=Tenacibaculum jejuense TaxID=584609 RepID=A0A238U8D1_9FLAO|nr:DUF6263 family protein [Tenacibaculum jejuense]SNR15417.1 protein of unknown function [Tenacibaculum jejuense]